MPENKKKMCFVLVAAIGVGFVSWATAAQQDVPAEVIARGKYMVVIGHCNNCHTPGFQQNAGNAPEKDWLVGRDIGHRGPWGTTYPTNLRINVNKMSEAEWIAYAQTLPALPGMPYWALRATHIEDLRAIYQFIRSLGPSDKPSRPTLPPGQEPQTLVIREFPVPPPAPRSANPDPAPRAAGASAAVLAQGRYMLLMSHCNNCHTANYGPLAGNVPEDDWLLGSPSGHRGSWGTTYGTNLRINAGAMSEAQWVAYVKAVKSRPPMPWWATHETHDEDLRAMYQFIRSLGPVGNPAPAALPPQREPTPPYTLWPEIFQTP